MAPFHKKLGLYKLKNDKAIAWRSDKTEGMKKCKALYQSCLTCLGDGVIHCRNG